MKTYKCSVYLKDGKYANGEIPYELYEEMDLAKVPLLGAKVFDSNGDTIATYTKESVTMFPRENILWTTVFDVGFKNEE